MPMHVDHIAEVSFKNHFLEVGRNAPKNGQIEVNDNTFEVSFENGRVNARFTTGNWFTNLFRFRTMDRFKNTLQAQYDNWIRETAAKSTAAQTGFKDNPNVPAVKTAVDECFDILHERAGSLDAKTLNCSKDVLKAYGTMHMVNGELTLGHQLNYDDLDRFEHFIDVMPPNLGKYAKRLGQIADLAAVRNELTTVATGTEVEAILLNRYGFATHSDLNGADKSEAAKKTYLLCLIDTLIDGFFKAFNAMTNKSVELFRLLEKLDGVCVEAKCDNIRDWLDRSMGIEKAVRSTEKDNLALCVTAEFNVLADEVKAPFREAARKECEAQVREACKKENIIDEVAIEQRIKEQVEVIIANKAGEIDPLIHQKIEADGKFALYDNLVGANRPVTLISKNKETGMWKVTTLVDENNKPILKPISAFDIDKQFDRLVAMYKEEAVAMGMVEYETRKVDVQFGNRNDLFALDVVNAASAVSKDDEEVKNLCQRVKKQVRITLDLQDDEFEAVVRNALDDVRNLRGLNDMETEQKFARFINNYADASYADQHSNMSRLANLVARRVETHNLASRNKTALADLDGKAARCAQMLKVAFQTKNKIVDVKEAQKAIAATLRIMIERVQADPNSQKNIACKQNLGKIMFNGRLFTDELTYDMSHRAAGATEQQLHNRLNTLLKCVEHYGKINPNTFVRNAAEGGAA